MARGIIIFGSSGAGTTTLGRAAAERLGFAHFDIDDTLWRWDTEIPFTAVRPREERIRLLTEQLNRAGRFVLSGSMDSIHEAFDPMFELGVHLTAPAELRVRRVRQRELERFGARILPGGDMHEVHLHFLDSVRRYDTDASPNRAGHEAWAESMPCPVIRADGSAKLSVNVEKILRAYEQTQAGNR